jgi:hypothetical protein
VKEETKEVIKTEVKPKEKAEPKPKELNPTLPVVEKKFEVDKKIGTYNGAATDKYNWSQSIKNIDVQIELPKGTTAKQLIVDYKPKYLKIQIKGSQKPLLEGELCEKIKAEETLWTIED